MKPEISTTAISREEYFAIAKASTFRAVSSPSFRHFDKPFVTHLHCVSEFASEDADPICSFIQRGSKVIFYRGKPNWDDWIKQIPDITKSEQLTAEIDARNSELLEKIRAYGGLINTDSVGITTHSNNNQ